MRLLIALLLLILPFFCLAFDVQVFARKNLNIENQSAQLFDIRVFKQQDNNMRLLLSLSAPVTHNIFTLNAPHRLVIDLKNTERVNNWEPSQASVLVKNIRSAPRNKHDLRVVFDLTAPVRTKSFLLKPDGTNRHRLVVDINTLEAPSVAKKSVPQKKSAQTEQPSVSQQTVTLKQSLFTHAVQQRDIVIAIDAGHGGIDPGATGHMGTQEKDIALTIAKELAALIAKERGMRAVLIRNDDYFIKLRKRIELARQYQADLFISIHADAYPEDENIQGASIYMISHRGASSEAAMWLAHKENAADLVGGVKLRDKDNLLAQVLLDLSQTNTLKASILMGQKVLKALRKVVKIHFTRIQRANFLVLRSPDIPSILVETGFLSNREEEQRLNNPKYRFLIANAILEGIREYFEHYAPPGTLLAHR